MNGNFGFQVDDFAEAQKRIEAADGTEDLECEGTTR
jgi:hypothetical protein